jgi:hypothetical protein
MIFSKNRKPLFGIMFEWGRPPIGRQALEMTPPVPQASIGRPPELDLVSGKAGFGAELLAQVVVPNHPEF